jgi:ribosomal protein S18 acetylase RimI-like enzyme
VNDTGTHVRSASPGDVAPLIAVHEAAFPGFFLTRMGPGFLRQLYGGFVEEAGGICLIAERQGKVAGFVAGTTSPRLFFSRLLRRRWAAFMLASLPPLARHPLLVGRRLLGALTYRGERPDHLDGGALLSSIAVTPSFSGSGVGATLVESFANLARERGARSIYLLTDRDSNEATRAFYVRCGFAADTTIQKADGRRMERYVRSLT